MPTIAVGHGTDSYTITIGTGVLERLPEVLAEACPAARYAVIADATVADLYGERVRALAARVAPADLLPFPAGEWNKTRAQWEALSDAMSETAIGRDGAVVALGGGVSGDLAGFVAATYRRGIPLVQVPTSVLAMLDSSIGGKTGVDTHHGKNLVGAMHHPRAVVADVALLGSLPEVHLRAGLAEAIKHGAVADRRHVEHLHAHRAGLLARDPDVLTELITASVGIKAGIVEEDAAERGRRAILNFGHTVGHAIEAVSGYATLHGEAVAAGMVVETAIGTALGVTAPGTTASLVEVLEGFGLPVAPPDIPIDQVLGAMQVDKKARAGAVRFAFLETLGQAAQSEAGEWTFPAPIDTVRTALTL